jgi:ribosomal-protein-alanine N-acetyltransferase
MLPSSQPRKTIETERVLIQSADPRFARSLAEFFKTQWDHLRPWSPIAEPEFFTEECQKKRLNASYNAFGMDSAWKWLLFEANQPAQIIGFIHYFQIVRGCHQGAILGYAIGKEWEGKGMMSEGLRATQAEVFGAGRLHRVQANVIPENVRSLTLLERLGFHREGIAEKYLCINGVWRDHVMTACLNPDFHDSWMS